MQRRKPPCAQFVIRTARHIRSNPANLKKSSKAGISLFRICRIAAQVYPLEEIRESLNVLLQKEQMFLFAIGCGARFESGRLQKLKPSRTELVYDLPAHAEVLQEIWCLDRNRDVVAFGSERTEYVLLRPKLYIVADGLPPKVAAVRQNKIGNVTALDILANIEDKRRLEASHDP